MLISIGLYLFDVVCAARLALCRIVLVSYVYMHYKLWARGRVVITATFGPSDPGSNSAKVNLSGMRILD